MIKLSNGHTFEYMAASSTLGFDGKGWWWQQPLRWTNLLDVTIFTSVTKTLTLQPVEGNWRWYNPFRCLRFIPGGVVNAIELTNLGIDWWRKEVGPSVDSSKISLIASIFGEPDELAEMAKIMSDFDLVGIEINTSCPSAKNDILQNTGKVIKSCEVVERNSHLPIILKMSVTHDAEKIVEETDKIIEAIAINSVPWIIVFPNCQSPLAKFGGGGVSGKAARPFTWSLVEQLSKSTSIPIIGPSISNFDDMEKVRKIGAKAVSFGSIFFPYSWKPTQYIRKESKNKSAD